MGFSCRSWLKMHQYVLVQDILKLGVKVGTPPPRHVLASDDSALSETHLSTLKLLRGGGERLGGGGVCCEAEPL